MKRTVAETLFSLVAANKLIPKRQESKHSHPKQSLLIGQHQNKDNFSYIMYKNNEIPLFIQTKYITFKEEKLKYS